MHRPIWLVAVLATLLSVGACQKTDVPSQPSGALARVNGEEILPQHVQKLVERTQRRLVSAGHEPSASLKSQIKTGALRKLIDEALIRQRAKQLGVTTEDVEIERAFGDYKNRMGGEQAFTEFLKRSRISPDELRDSLRSSLLRQKLVDNLAPTTKVSDVAVLRFYEKNKSIYIDKDEVSVRHILLKTLAKANDVITLARKPKADFAALAKKYGEGDLAKQGGDLGVVTRGRMLKAFEDAAFAAKEGQVVGPVQTENGYHVIWVYKKKAARQKSFAEVKDAIALQLASKQRTERFDLAMKILRGDAKIEML